VPTASLWFLCCAIMNQGAAMVVPMVIGSLPNVTSFDGFRRIFICIMLSSVLSGVMWFFIRGVVKGVVVARGRGGGGGG
ncbi:hypothetical protein NQU33_26860, partial [Escherichia coli]|nr:hypothetical protein [Escherichia coli]